MSCCLPLFATSTASQLRNYMVWLSMGCRAFQERKMAVNSAVEVCLHDVSTYVTWVKVRNVPFEAEEYVIRKVFGKYGTVHAVTKGVWREGPYEGLPEGSCTLKMTLKQPIPSYVHLEHYRTQVFVHYAGIRKTCRLCNSYDHMAAQCSRRLVVRIREPSPVVLRTEAFDLETGPSPEQGPKLWSEEVQQEEMRSMACATLSVDTTNVPMPPVGPTEPVGLSQESLLENVLNDLLDGAEHSPDVSPECQEVVKDDSPNMGDLDVTTMTRMHEVVVEVHQEASSGEMCVEVGSRKRTAGVSDMDEVLTPGQRPGKKLWSKVSEASPADGVGASAQHMGRARGG
nr:uncharacterized protein LOC128700494 [Cherax quadricarinatus]